MNKKYTVFVSSTYKDLKDERKKILDNISGLDYIPIGMEYFPAADDEQFSIIKKLIDDCDYYILIIGGRYGSINEKTSLSYTEMEYNYAVQKKIPVLVFAHGDAMSLPNEKRDEEKHLIDKLERFRKSAMENRLARIWGNIEDLISSVVVSLVKATREIERPGWTRGSKEDIEVLVSENRQLRLKIDELTKKVPFNNDKVIWDERVMLHFTERHFVYTSETITNEFDKEYSLEEIFKIISIKLTSPKTNTELQNAFDTFNSGYYVSKEQVLQIRTKFMILNLVEISNEPNIAKKTGMKYYEEYTKLTTRGLQEMKRLNK